MSKPKQKKKKWIRFRHKVVTFLAYLPVYIYSRIKYGLRVERFKDKTKRPYLILMNHQTAFDQFFVSFAFNRVIYFVASEDLFSMGWLSSLIRYIVAPIPIRKQTTDVSAVMTCLRVAREGGTIAMAPEGNRTYSGKTEYMNPAVAPLARKLGLPIALFRIEGGYGVHPRWSDVKRKGKMRCFVSEVIETEEYKTLTDDELYTRITKGLYVNEAAVRGEFCHKNSAEYLERALYTCPDCGLSTLESGGDLITCKKCGLRVRYLPTKELEGVDKSIPFKFTNDWYEYQCELVNNLDTRLYTETPLFSDTADLSEVIVYEKKVPIAQNVGLALYGDRIELSGCEQVKTFPFDKVSAVTVLGKNKVNIYIDKKIYQLKGDKRFNGLKYVNIFYRNKNIAKGEENGKFLGL